MYVSIVPESAQGKLFNVFSSGPLHSYLISRDPSETSLLNFVSDITVLQTLLFREDTFESPLQTVLWQ